MQEAENQIITHYEVFAGHPEDSRLLVPAVEQHQRQFGRPPRMVAANAGFYSLKNERTIQAMGVRRVAVPKPSTLLLTAQYKCEVGTNRIPKYEQAAGWLDQNRSFCDGK